MVPLLTQLMIAALALFLAAIPATFELLALIVPSFVQFCMVPPFTPTMPQLVPLLAPAAEIVPELKHSSINVLASVLPVIPAVVPVLEVISA